MTDLTPRVPARPLLWPDVLLDLADWLLDQDDPHPVHIVGGAVRDAYLGYPLKDIDLVTPIGAVKLARRIADAFSGDVFVLDAEREVARVLLDTPHGKLNIDVAGYRAHDLLADLTDRDFTVNAMAVDLRGDTGKLIDPLNGEADLKAKVIRRCSPHAIEKDPIRALRAVRQSIQLNARVEPETLADLKANATELHRTSPERIRDEFFKILAGARPWAGLRAITQLGLMPAILPDAAALPAPTWNNVLASIEHAARIFETISPARTENTAATFGLGMFVVALDRYRRRLQEHLALRWPNERPHTALLYLALLARGLGKPARQTASDLAETLRLSNPERTRLEAVITPAGSLLSAHDQPLDVLSQHRYWHTLGEAGLDVLLLTLAEYLAQHSTRLNQDAWLKVMERAQTLVSTYYDRHETIVSPPALLDGTQLMRALKLKPGPMIKELLDVIREQTVLGHIHTRDDAIEAARAYLSRLN